MNGALFAVSLQGLISFDVVLSLSFLMMDTCVFVGFFGRGLLDLGNGRETEFLGGGRGLHLLAGVLFLVIGDVSEFLLGEKLLFEAINLLKVKVSDVFQFFLER